jgi:hypothetical protein
MRKLTMASEFRLRALGDNIESGDVVKVSLSAGDSNAKDQTVLELEMDKALRIDWIPHRSGPHPWQNLKEKGA